MGMFGAIGQYLSNPDNLAGLGATLKDVGANLNGEDSNNVLAVQQAIQDRKAKATRDAFQQQLAGMLGQGGPNSGFMAPSTLPQGSAPPAGAISESLPGSGGGLNINDPRLPALALQAHDAGYDMSGLLEVLKAQKPADPRVIEGPDGIYRETPEHGFTKVQPYAPTIPFGWEIGPDNNPRPRTGGPADPAYIGRTAGVRRDAIVSRPTPSRAQPHAANPNTIKWD